MRTQISRALLVTLTVLLVGGCAGTGTQAAKPLPPAKALQPTDLASLAGDWEGTLEGGSGPFTGRRTSLVRVTVAPDGSYTTNISGERRPAMAAASFKRSPRAARSSRFPILRAPRPRAAPRYRCR